MHLRWWHFKSSHTRLFLQHFQILLLAFPNIIIVPDFLRLRKQPLVISVFTLILAREDELVASLPALFKFKPLIEPFLPQLFLLLLCQLLDLAMDNPILSFDLLILPILNAALMGEVQ